MPFDAHAGRRRIAVIGGGISRAWRPRSCLEPGRRRSRSIEAEPRLGGHARTVMAGRSGDQPVDTGFIVFNHATYPHLGRLFRELDVPVERSDMSFGVSIDDGRIEYALQRLRGPASPSVATSLSPALPAHAARHRPLQPTRRGRVAEEGQTVGELVTALGLGEGFRRHYLRPFCGAIWSMPEAEVDAFPATLLVRFFRNHGLLGTDRPAPVVDGGGRQRRVYVDPARPACWRRAASASAPARRCDGSHRDEAGVGVQAAGGAPERFDQVVLACHSDQACACSTAPTGAERSLLGAIRYRPNRASCCTATRPDAAAPRLLVELGLSHVGRARRRDRRSPTG